ncbi:10-methenyltetrahydromethanopterin hydrogenase [Striga asiatica]|uniref:10-methenyltetrahydromethanopterin hydrogenase n=1 Tax=Striga asiatica TaxID=4170 RepID=A0A5A7P3P1_STRAF|nr:10-methenyltetrahydromethanopterin hydrogenase [Striga asiatica]
MHTKRKSSRSIIIARQRHSSLIFVPEWTRKTSHHQRLRKRLAFCSQELVGILFVLVASSPLDSSKLPTWLVPPVSPGQALIPKWPNCRFTASALPTRSGPYTGPSPATSTGHALATEPSPFTSAMRCLVEPCLWMSWNMPLDLRE